MFLGKCSVRATPYADAVQKSVETTPGLGEFGFGERVSRSVHRFDLKFEKCHVCDTGGFEYGKEDLAVRTFSSVEHIFLNCS